MDKKPYGFSLHQSGGKVFISPLGCEPLEIIGDEAVFANEDGVSRTRSIGTIDDDGLIWRQEDEAWE